MHLKFAGFRTKLVPAAVAVMALAAASADAATYSSFFEYADPAAGLGAAPYGEVKLTEGGSGIGAYVDVHVDLFNGSRFVLTSNGTKHNAFVWNLTNPGAAVITILAPVGSFVVDSTLPDSNVPFGTFSNGVGCCNGTNGAPGANDPPLNFRITDANGITMLGVGGSFNGTTLTFGSGDHFLSNTTGSSNGFTGGWWFSSDIITTGGFTGNVAARNFIASPVPEPETYAMLLAGLGLMGFVSRRRKQQAA